MMTDRPDQVDPNCNHSRMICRACIQPPLYVYGIDAIIGIQMLKTSHIFIIHLAALENGRNPDIGTLKKDRGGIFS